MSYNANQLYFSYQPVLFPYVSQYILEVVPVYFQNFTGNNSTLFSVDIPITETKGTIPLSTTGFLPKHTVSFSLTEVSVKIDRTSSGTTTTVASWLYQTNTSFPTTTLKSGQYIRVYRVGDVMTACIIVGTTQLTIATIDLSTINKSLNRTFSFDTNYDVIPISLYGNTQFSRVTMYALPILERITDRIPDTTVYTSWDQTYSSSNLANYTAGSIVQDNNSLYIQTNLPNNAILDRTINIPVYESSFTAGNAGSLIGESNADGIGTAAGLANPISIDRGTVGSTPYLFIGQPDRIRFFNINTSNVTTLSSTVAPTALGPVTVCNNTLYWYYAEPNTSGYSVGLYSLSISNAVAGTGIATFLTSTGVNTTGKRAMSMASDRTTYVYFVIEGDGLLSLYQYDTVNGGTPTLISKTNGSGIQSGSDLNNWSTPSFISAPTYFGMVCDSGTKNLYFCDTGRHSVRAFISSGTLGSFTGEAGIFTLAGSESGAVGYVDGIGTTARFSSPSGLTIIPTAGGTPSQPTGGALFVCDPGNNLIRVIFIASNQTNTSAGQYQVSGFLDANNANSTFGTPKAAYIDPGGGAIYITDTEYGLLRQINNGFSNSSITTLAGNLNALFDLYANDKLTVKIVNNNATYASGGGLTVVNTNNGTSITSITYYSNSEGSVIEFTPLQGEGSVWPYVQISASPGGYTYVQITSTGAVYNNGITTVTTPYSNSYVWASGDTIRVIKQVNNIFVQYVRNNIIKNVLGFNGTTPLYNSSGYQQEVVFTVGGLASSTLSASIPYLAEYSLPVWDLLLTDASANVTENFSVAVGSGLNSIIYSANGLAWFPVSGSQFSISGSRVAWDGSMWYAVGSGTSPILWSSNGTNWSSAGITYPAGFTGGTDIASNGKTWVAVGTSTTNPVIQSTSSLAWNAVSAVGLTGANAVATNGTSWVIGCTGSSHPIFYSPDGTNWSSSTSSTGIFTACNGVAANNSLWIAVGYGTNKLAYSPDGLVWTGVSSVFTSSGNGVAWNGNEWIAVGNGTTNHMYSSKDGISWTPITTGFGTSSIGKSIAWNGNVWIAAGTWYNSGNTTIVSSIITSPDGSNWTIISGTPFTKNIANGCAARKPLSTTVNSTVSSKGFFTYTGAAPMTINNSTVKSTSNIILTLSSASPSVPTTIPFVTGITGGTSFSVTGVSTDRSIYNYIIL